MIPKDIDRRKRFNLFFASTQGKAKKKQKIAKIIRKILNVLRRCRGEKIKIFWSKRKIIRGTAYQRY